MITMRSSLSPARLLPLATSRLRAVRLSWSSPGWGRRRSRPAASTRAGSDRCRSCRTMPPRAAARATAGSAGASGTGGRRRDRARRHGRRQRDRRGRRPTRRRARAAVRSRRSAPARRARSGQPGRRASPGPRASPGRPAQPATGGRRQRRARRDGGAAGTTAASPGPAGTAGTTGVAGTTGAAGTTGVAGTSGRWPARAGIGGRGGTGGGNGGRGGTGGGTPCTPMNCSDGCCSDSTTCIRNAHRPCSAAPGRHLRAVRRLPDLLVDGPVPDRSDVALDDRRRSRRSSSGGNWDRQHRRDRRLAARSVLRVREPGRAGQHHDRRRDRHDHGHLERRPGIR